MKWIWKEVNEIEWWESGKSTQTLRNMRWRSSRLIDYKCDDLSFTVYYSY